MKARSGSRNVRPDAAGAVLGIHDDRWIAVYSLNRQRIEQSLRCSWSSASRGLFLVLPVLVYAGDGPFFRLFVIGCEERALGRRFGGAYVGYVATVRT